MLFEINGNQMVPNQDCTDAYQCPARDPIISYNSSKLSLRPFTIIVTQFLCELSVLVILVCILYSASLVKNYSSGVIPDHYN